MDGTKFRMQSRRLGTIYLAAFMVISLSVGTLSLSGCAHRYGHLIANDEKDMVGSHEAGAATWNPLVDSSVAKLLGRCPPSAEPIMPGQIASLNQTPAMMASHAMAITVTPWAITVTPWAVTAKWY